MSNQMKLTAACVIFALLHRRNSPVQQIPVDFYLQSVLYNLNLFDLIIIFYVKSSRFPYTKDILAYS